MNRYGIGPGVVRRRRSYMVEAECRIKAGFYARSAEELMIWSKPVKPGKNPRKTAPKKKAAEWRARCSS